MKDESTTVLTTPAKRLEHALRALHGRGFRQADVAQALGHSSGFTSELVNGKKRLRADHAVKIEETWAFRRCGSCLGKGRC